MTHVSVRDDVSARVSSRGNAVDVWHKQQTWPCCHTLLSSLILVTTCTCRLAFYTHAHTSSAASAPTHLNERPSTRRKRARQRDGGVVVNTCEAKSFDANTCR